MIINLAMIDYMMSWLHLLELHIYSNSNSCYLAVVILVIVHASHTFNI